PPPRLYRSHKAKVSSEDEFPKRAPSKVSGKKHRQRNREAQENRKRRRTHGRTKCPLRAKENNKTEPECQCCENDRSHACMSIIPFRSHIFCESSHSFIFHVHMPFLSVLVVVGFSNMNLPYYLHIASIKLVDCK